jgi:glycosyltransferase involved in cell wall biosynthesis
VGGAQRLWWGLIDIINARTAHQADLITLPAPEHDFFSTIASYARFAALDLSGFDRIVSTKYPAWAVRHPDHRIYIQHMLRGLYDTYSGPLEIPAAADKHARTRRVLELTEPAATLSDANIEELYSLLDKIGSGDTEERLLYPFPGPLARRVIHALDRFATSPRHIRRYGAISATVAHRGEYFPHGAAVDVIHHPSNLSVLTGDAQKYFLTVSRLDGPKRIDLIIRAMRETRTTLPLKIAGAGPQEERLRALAGDDPRIEFLGYRSDRELAALYSDALAVLFVPQDEDYGLVTVEAFAAAKPVITVSDAGGPTELVRHGTSGWVVPPTVSAVARAITEAGANAEDSARRGRAAAVAGAQITWSRLIDWLVQP